MSELREVDDAWAPAARDDVSTSIIDGETVMFDPTSSRVHQLDAVGTIVWQLLDGNTTVGELVADLSAAFETPSDRVRADVVALLELLSEQGLLQGRPPVVPGPDLAVDRQQPRYLVDPPAP